jgi:hypothetical protein
MSAGLGSGRGAAGAGRAVVSLGGIARALESSSRDGGRRAIQSEATAAIVQTANAAITHRRIRSTWRMRYRSMFFILSSIVWNSFGIVSVPSIVVSRERRIPPRRPF